MNQTPKEELNSLLNDAIGMAIRLVEKHGSHFPFCLAITTSGERTSIAADDSNLPGADALLAGFVSIFQMLRVRSVTEQLRSPVTLSIGQRLMDCAPMRFK